MAPWEVKKLGDIGKIYNGNSINEKVKKDKYTDVDEGLPFIATKDVSYVNIIDYDNGIKIPFEEKEQFKIAPKNTVLICAEGGSAGRKIGFTNQDICFGNKLFALTTNENIESRYVFYYYFSSSFQKQFSLSLAGLIGGVSMNKFKEIEIPTPSLPEQKRIVANLDEAFESIAKAKKNAEKNRKNAKEIFESYLQSVFENKGEGWEEKTLGEICTKITDGVHKKPHYVPEGIP
ncbi:MAG: restriction endonuclease subunit S, partial [Candidatus Methanoperedens sp.]